MACTTLLPPAMKIFSTFKPCRRKAPDSFATNSGVCAPPMDGSLPLGSANQPGLSLITKARSKRLPRLIKSLSYVLVPVIDGKGFADPSFLSQRNRLSSQSGKLCSKANVVAEERNLFVVDPPTRFSQDDFSNSGYGPIESAVETVKIGPRVSSQNRWSKVETFVAFTFPHAQHRVVTPRKSIVIDVSSRNSIQMHARGKPGAEKNRINRIGAHNDNVHVLCH